MNRAPGAEFVDHTDVRPREAEPHAASADIPPFDDVNGGDKSGGSRTAARSILVSLADQALVSAAGLATSVVLGRFSGKEELGVYYLALSLILLMRGLQEPVICTPYLILCHRTSRAELPRYTASCLAHQLAFGLAALVLLAAMAAASILGLGPTGFAATAIVLPLVAPLLLLREMMRQVSLARLQIERAVALDAIAVVLQIGGLALLVRCGVLSAPAVYVVIGIACAAACAAWSFRYRRALRFHPAQLAADWRRNWGLGKWALAGQFAGSIGVYLVPWILAELHGARMTGLLAACTTLVGLGNMLLIGLANYVAPKVAHAYAAEGPPGLQRVLAKSLLLLCALLGALLLALIALGEPLVAWVYGPQYAGAGAVVVILGASLLASGLSMIAADGLLVLQRLRVNFVIDVCTTVLTLCAAFYLIDRFGTLGAACALLTSTSCGAALRGIALYRVFPQSDTSAALCGTSGSGTV
jgi:O-antigen/teichoic acid export membrane protein